MLQEAHRLQKDGVDIIVAVVETHGRVETANMVTGLELIPKLTLEYRGITVEEMDVDAVLKRRPEVALVDELAHTNAPGSRNNKRYEDVRELLAAGIHVIATLNVQHLESLYNTVENLIGVKVRERIPDAMVAEADQIVNVDLTPEDLQARLAEGKIYPKERVNLALENFFTQGKLEHLRELTMREIASQIDFKRREILDDGDKIVPDQVMVCLASKGPNSARLLRFASRLAGRLNRTWYAVYVQTPKEAPTIIDATTQRLLADTLTLANQLGATVFTFKGEDIVDTILKFATEYRVGHIVIGRPRNLSKWKRILGKRSVAEDLVIRAEGFTVVVVDADSQPHSAPLIEDRTSEEISGRPAIFQTTLNRISDTLTENRICIIKSATTKGEVMKRLVDLIVTDQAELNAAAALAALFQREEQGSTFLNESVAIPHARISGLHRPELALAITRQGVSDVNSELPIEAVLLLLAPLHGDANDLRLLTKAIRMFQDLNLRRKLLTVDSKQEVLSILANSEAQI
jgi:two-component system sensor histidine kinase KdpD